MPTLKELRIKNKKTLKEVSRHIGISFSSLCKIENGMCKLDNKLKNKLREYYQEDFEVPLPLSYTDYKRTVECLDAAKQLIKILNNRVTYYENFINTLHEDLGLMLQDIRPLGK